VFYLVHQLDVNGYMIGKIDLYLHSLYPSSFLMDLEMYLCIIV